MLNVVECPRCEMQFAVANGLSGCPYCTLQRDIGWDDDTFFTLIETFAWVDKNQERHQVAMAKYSDEWPEIIE